MLRTIAALFTTIAAAAAPAQIRVTVDARSAATPASILELIAPLNAVVSGRIVLFNPGAEGSFLNWEATASASSCSTPQPVRWLDIEPAFGSLDGGHSTDVAIYASSFAARARMRRGFLCIRSGTRVEPLAEVRIALTVDGSASAEP